MLQGRGREEATYKSSPVTDLRLYLLMSWVTRPCPAAREARKVLIPESHFKLKLMGSRRRESFPGGSGIKNSPTIQEPRVRSLGWEDPPEESMAADSSILTRRIPWTEEPGGLQSVDDKELDTMEVT